MQRWYVVMFLFAQLLVAPIAGARGPALNAGAGGLDLGVRAVSVVTDLAHARLVNARCVGVLGAGNCSVTVRLAGPRGCEVWMLSSNAVHAISRPKLVATPNCP
jgi:hypothetical protein